MKVFIQPQKSIWSNILKRPTLDYTALMDKVTKIVKEVQLNGDAALKQFTEQFDGILLENIQASRSEMELAENLISDELKLAIQVAANNIKTFHANQETSVTVIETMQGIQCWRKNVAIEKVGIYIPGGTAPLFSTVLMLALPAQLAGCREIVLCSPPNAEGKLHPAILYASKIAGVHQVFKIGGVQAIAAMAFGTESIPQVYKIFGPGNQYVTAAKQLIQQYGVAIDMPAGPSEVCVYADESADADFVAADLLSQAEHGKDSQVCLIASSEQVVRNVQNSIELLIQSLQRREIAEAALKNSIAIVVNEIEEAISIINTYAPEHLILSCNNAEALAEKIINAGSVFIGHFTPESLGDYASGTNHTLPTNGYARMYSGVSLDSYVKKITFQKANQQGLQNIGNHVMKMAESEGLDAHAKAVAIRLKKMINTKA